MQKTSDQEIRGTKEALIQDLEKKLRCKDSLLQNGNQVRIEELPGGQAGCREAAAAAPGAGAPKLS